MNERRRLEKWTNQFSFRYRQHSIAHWVVTCERNERLRGPVGSTDELINSLSGTVPIDVAHAQYERIDNSLLPAYTKDSFKMNKSFINDPSILHSPWGRPSREMHKCLYLFVLHIWFFWAAFFPDMSARYPIWW